MTRTNPTGNHSPINLLSSSKNPRRRDYLFLTEEMESWKVPLIFISSAEGNKKTGTVNLLGILEEEKIGGNSGNGISGSASRTYIF